VTRHSRDSGALESFVRFLGCDSERVGRDSQAKQGPDLDPEAIADVLWLAVNHPALAWGGRVVTPPVPPNQDDKEQGETPNPDVGPEPLSDSTEPIFSAPVTSVVAPKSKETRWTSHRLEAQLLPEASVPGSERLPVRVRDPLALPDPQRLFEAVLPLMQEVAGDRPASLDEEATLERYVLWRQLMPVWRPDQHYRFLLTLMIDEGFSMSLWQPLLDKLSHCLRGFHGFQGIRVVPWATDPSNEADRSDEPFAETAALIDRQGPASDGLVVVVSDCAGLKWWAKGGVGPGPAFSLLQRLGASRPVAIWQVLPDWMWRRTALGQEEAVALRRSSEGSAWPFQLARPLETRSHGEGGPLRPLPVFELTLAGLRTWGKLFSGSPFMVIPGILLPKQPIDRPRASEPERQPPDEEASAKKLEQPDALLPLRRFQHLASPNAQRLLALFAAAPVLTLPVMRLIQAELLEGIGTSAMAEVLLSGLLRPVARATPLKPETLQLTFAAPIRAALLRQQSPDTTLEVIEAVTDFINSHWSQQGWGSFLAFLTDPAIAAPFQLKQIHHFARLRAEIIAELGGHYRTFAEQLREAQRKNPWPSNLFTFQEVDCEVAQLVRIPELEPVTVVSASLRSVEGQDFEFETATLQGSVLAKQTARVRGFCEPLEPGWAEASQRRPVCDSGVRGATLAMLQIPSGRFLMGSPPDEAGHDDDEGPQHDVELGEFFLSRTLVTQAQWRAVAQWKPMESEDPWPRALDADPVSQLSNAQRFLGEQRPVVNVSWHDAMEFCYRLRVRTGKHYTLPSEAQWEYACRAGTTTPFYFGTTLISELANYDDSLTSGNGQKDGYRQQTTEVTSFYANAWGLYDMHGNVWEWCADQWHSNYDKAPADGSPWIDNKTDDDSMKLLRGGSWDNDSGLCRSAYRARIHPAKRSIRFGFRVCCLPQDPIVYT
jgi:formylglycine-generating enzyme required for sulfatase activity